jgi:hypothetical protein
VAAALSYSASLEDDDLVDEFEFREPMGDEQSRAIGGSRKEVSHECVGGGLVEIGGGFVEDDGRKIGQQRPRNGKPTAFSLGESMSTFAEMGVETIG